MIMAYEIIFGFAVLIFVLLIWYIKKLRKELTDTKFQKQSLSVKYGKMAEQFIPFIRNYPYDKQNFRFIGTPIDGIQFENDKVIFLEFKIGDSKLSKKQQEIKKIVENQKVEFEELRIK